VVRKGIGRAIAQRLLAAGAQVRIWDRDEQLLARTIAELSAGVVSGDVIDVTIRTQLSARLTP
jgi:NAD(P)-dependent dehydrogenase (short-subunit alcohol dehydrogenase family)